VNGTASVRPTWWLYVLGVGLMTIGVGIFIYTLWHGISHVTDSLVQVVVPGESELTLKLGQSYTVFLESQSVVNGKIYSTTDAVNGLECKVNAVSNGEVITIRRSTMSTTYDVGGRSGRSVLEFHVPQDGSYRFACGYGDAGSGPEAVLAVGSGVGERIMRTVFTSLMAIFGGLGFGLIVCIVTFVLRQRAKNRPMAPNPAPL